MAWTLFYNPMTLSSDAWALWLVLPLCATVAIVYKTIRIKDLRRLPLEASMLFGLIIAGLAALGAGLWGIHILFL